MAVLLWELVITAAFVVVAVGALAYVLANLLLGAIHKRAEKRVADLEATHVWRRSQRQTGDGLGARLARTIARKSIFSPWASKRAAPKAYAGKQPGKL